MDLWDLAVLPSQALRDRQAGAGTPPVPHEDCHPSLKEVQKSQASQSNGELISKEGFSDSTAHS